MKLQFAGPSAPQGSKAHGVSRTVNMYPVRLEGVGERAEWGLRDLPGLVASAWVMGGELRGAEDVNGRVFVVAGDTLWELVSDGTKINRGTLGSSTGRVGMAWNISQLVLSDASLLYVLDLTSGVLSSAAFPGGRRIQYIDQFVVFAYRDSQQFGWTSLGDASSIDLLDFASAEGSPDDIVELIVDHRELIPLGRLSGEVWSVVGGEDVFARNGGAFFEVGAAAELIAQKIAGSTVWLGNNGRVFKLDGYREVAISADWVEDRIHGLDLSGATSYAAEFGGHAFYCLNVPGVDTTLAYDMKTGYWSEWAELVNGDYAQHRAVFTFRAFGKVLAAGSDGVLYEMTPDAHDNAGDELVRDRVFEFPMSGGGLQRFGRLVVTCDTGFGGVAQVRYTTRDDIAFGSWRVASMGAIGHRDLRVKWERTGAARRRIWQLRCTDNVPFNPVAAEVS